MPELIYDDSPFSPWTRPNNHREAKRLEALRYFEEVDIHPADWTLCGWAEWPWPGTPVGPRPPGTVRTYRGAFERYQRLGVAVYDGRGR